MTNLSSLPGFGASSGGGGGGSSNQLIGLVKRHTADINMMPSTGNHSSTSQYMCSPLGNAVRTNKFLFVVLSTGLASGSSTVYTVYANARVLTIANDGSITAGPLTSFDTFGYVGNVGNFFSGITSRPGVQSYSPHKFSWNEGLVWNFAADHGTYGSANYRTGGCFALYVNPSTDAITMTGNIEGGYASQNTPYKYTYTYLNVHQPRLASGTTHYKFIRRATVDSSGTVGFGETTVAIDSTGSATLTSDLTVDSTFGNNPTRPSYYFNSHVSWFYPDQNLPSSNFITSVYAVRRPSVDGAHNTLNSNGYFTWAFYVCDAAGNKTQHLLDYTQTSDTGMAHELLAYDSTGNGVPDKVWHQTNNNSYNVPSNIQYDATNRATTPTLGSRTETEYPFNAPAELVGYVHSSSNSNPCVNPNNYNSGGLSLRLGTKRFTFTHLKYYSEDFANNQLLENEAVVLPSFSYFQTRSNSYNSQGLAYVFDNVTDTTPSNCAFINNKSDGVCYVSTCTPPSSFSFS